MARSYLPSRGLPLSRREMLTGAVGAMGGTTVGVVASGPLGAPRAPAATGAEPPPPAPGTALAGQDALSAARQGVAADGVTDVTAALNDLVGLAKRHAASTWRASGGMSCASGLRRVYLPAGTYRLTGPVNLHGLRGLVLEGDGMESTILCTHTGQPVFDVWHASELVLRNLTLTSLHPGTPAGAPVRSLVEHSTGVLLHQAAADTARVGAPLDTVVRFENVEFVGLHRGVWLRGDVMTDGVVWQNCKWRDNFYDFAYDNPQAVNHQVHGGEALGFVDLPESAYDARLSSWSTPVSTRDGAMFHVLQGGGVKVTGGSVIRMNTTLLVGDPPSGVPQTHRFVFDTTRWEIRHADLADTNGDADGLDRCAVVRWAQPYPPGEGPTALRAEVDFHNCAFAVQPAASDLLYLRDDTTIAFENSRVQAPGPVHLVSLVTAATPRRQGRFHGRASTLLARRRAAPVPLAGLAHSDHVIYQDRAVAPAAQTGDGLARESDHTVTGGMHLPLKRALAMEPDGTIPAGVVRLPLPAGAVLSRVGAVGLGSGDQAFRHTVTNGDSTASYGVLASDWSVDVAPLAATVFGARAQACRCPFFDSGQIATDGVIVFTPTEPPPAGLPGYLYVDYF